MVLNNAAEQANITLFLAFGVLTTSLKLNVSPILLSNSIVSTISRYCNITMSSTSSIPLVPSIPSAPTAFNLPSAWVCARTSKHASFRPFQASQRGDSGMNGMMIIQRRLKTPWTMDGMRQAQVDGMKLVPKVTPAAISPPLEVQHKMYVQKNEPHTRNGRSEYTHT